LFSGTFWGQDIPLERYLSWFRYIAFWPLYLIIVINAGILRVGDPHSLASATRWWKLPKNLTRIKSQGNFIALKFVVTEIKLPNEVSRTLMWNTAWSEGGILVEELLMVMCRVCNSI
jgi:hypothetical protein